VTRRLDAIAEGVGDTHDIETIGERLRGVTDQNRCYLGEEEQRTISSLLRSFPEEFVAALEAGGSAVDTPVIPKIVDLVDGRAIYDERQRRKNPDWTYAAA